MAYDFNLNEVFEMAIQIEANGANFYRKAAGFQNNPADKDFLEKLARMEDATRILPIPSPARRPLKRSLPQPSAWKKNPFSFIWDSRIWYPPNTAMTNWTISSKKKNCTSPS